MKLQMDVKMRVVFLSNFQAMCQHLSLIAHKFSITKISRSRVYVEYSNPDEYGVSHPMTAVFPCFPFLGPEYKNNPAVILNIMRVINDNWDGEGWQAFEQLMYCPTLYRNPNDKKWYTRSEITKQENNEPDTNCSCCHKPISTKTAHLHQGEWIGDECCWDERLRASE